MARHWGAVVLASLLAGAAQAQERYQMVALPSCGLGPDRVVILDTVAGHLWTWNETSAGPDDAADRTIVYQGQLRPGTRMGEVVERQGRDGP